MDKESLIWWWGSRSQVLFFTSIRKYVIGEVENAAFGSASSSIIGSTLWFLGVMAMYEGGLFDSVVAGGQQHIISAPGVSERIVSALRRGRACTQDLLDIDYFNFAERPLEELQCEWGISP